MSDHETAEQKADQLARRKRHDEQVQRDVEKLAALRAGLAATATDPGLVLIADILLTDLEFRYRGLCGAGPQTLV